MATFIEILKVLVFGVAEGFTEWLPISSTGHIILLDEITPLSVSTEFKDMFMVVIQLGTILAVVVLYFHRLNPSSLSKTEKQERATVRLWTRILVAYIPVVVIGLLIDDWMEIHLTNGYVVTAILIIHGVLFIVIERYSKGQKPIVEKARNITCRLVLCIGLFQAPSLVPGAPRSGATIPRAVLLGCSRGVAVELSFFLGIPVMFGISLLRIVKFGLGNFKGTEVFYLPFGMVVAFLIFAYSIKLPLDYIRKNDLTVFGLYRIGLGIVVLIYFVVARLMAG